MRRLPASMRLKTAKSRKCKVCKSEFAPRMSTAKVCSLECAQSLAVSVRLKAAKVAQVKDRRETKVKLRELEPIAKLEKRAEAAVNAYVRVRDRDKGCISCDKPANWDGQWHASHFRSVGAASAIRFHLWNIHKGCSICNHHLSGNIAAYTPRLVELIGQERVDWLKSQNQITRYSREYLERLRAVFAKKTRRLLARCQA